ncbi:MAG: DUF6785 family protein [Desulfobacterales bacterium]
MPDSPKTKTGIRLRAVVIGIAIALIICAVTPFNNAQRQGTPLGGGHFPLAPFFVLVWLMVIVAGLRKVFRKYSWMTGKELLTAWILMVLVSGIAYTGLVRTFFINLSAPYYFATVENRWDETLHPLMPEKLYPQNDEAVQGLYNGLLGGRQMPWSEVLVKIPWDAWITPLLVWGCFIFLSYFTMICLVNLLSRQWLNNERMNFPLLRVPQLMEEHLDGEGLGKFFSNKFLIAGLVIPVFLHTINGLHFYHPSIPQIPTLILAGPYFPRHGLFAAFYKLTIYIYPAFIGFAFLASKQISFSFWFFFLAGGFLIGILSVLGYSIPAASLGITFGPTLSRPEETQMIGAYGVFFIFILWLARYHFLDVFKRSFMPWKTEPSPTEWFSLPVSFWGFFIGISGIIIWCVFFGIPVLPSILLVGAFFMIMLVASRVICQGGLAYFTLTAAPIDGLLVFFGPKFFTGAGLLVAAVAQKVLFLDLRESLMPSLVHAREITRKITNRRLIIGFIMITLVAGVAVSFIAMLALCYKFGIRELGLDWASRTTLAVYENVNTLVEMPAKPGEWVTIFAIAGAVVMLVLVVCYHRFYWWPIHPIGYLTAYSSAMRILWFSFFVGWLCNMLCIRYGGVALFKKLRFFFIGLIIGDFLMGGLWAVIGIFSDASYLVLPD